MILDVLLLQSVPSAFCHPRLRAGISFFNQKRAFIVQKNCATKVLHFGEIGVKTALLCCEKLRN